MEPSPQPPNLEPPAPKLQSNFVPVLPAEIRGEIVKWHPNLLRQSQILSKGTAQVAAPHYLEQLCNQPISPSEFQTYLATEPNLVAEFDVNTLVDTAGEWFEVMDSFYSLKSENDLLISKIGLYITHGFATFHYSEIGMYIAKITPMGYENSLKDLLTSYRIYQQRQRCQTLFSQLRPDASWAGMKVRADFNFITSTGYRTWSSFPLLSELKLYQYLHVNCAMLAEAGYLLLYSFPSFIEFQFPVDHAQIQFDRGHVIPASVHLLPLSTEQEATITEIRHDSQTMIKLLKEAIAKW